MRSLQVSFDGINYPYFYGRRCLDEIALLLSNVGADRLFVVADSRAAAQYGAELHESLSAHTPTRILIQAEGEHQKHLKQVEELVEQMLGLGATRASLVVGLGGGTTGNVAGLAAGLLYRGVRLVHIPTTLVAMLDSVISLKQAVNSRISKNQIGIYHTPLMVLADIAVLRTLRLEHIMGGFCELAKNALAIRPDLVDHVLALRQCDLASDVDAFEQALLAGVEPKLQVMACDRYERRLGLTLEYGHTVGHALELGSPSGISHGNAIGIGMLVAAETAGHLGYLDKASVDRHWQVLELLGSSCRLPPGVTTASVMSRVRSDNKNGLLLSGREQVSMVLLSGLGQPVMNGELPIVSVPENALSSVLDSFPR